MLDKDLQAWIIGKPKNRDTVLSMGEFLPVVELVSVRAPETAPVKTAPVAKESSLDDQNPPFIEELLDAEEIPVSELPPEIPKIETEKIQPEPRDEAVIQEPVIAKVEPSLALEDVERNSRVAHLTEQFRQNQRTVSYQSGLRKKRLWMFSLLLLLLLGLLGAWSVSVWSKARSVVVQAPEPVSQDFAPPEPVSQDVVSDDIASDDVVSDDVVSGEVVSFEIIAPPEPPVEIVILPPPVKIETPPQVVKTPVKRAPQKVSKPAQKKQTPAPRPAKKSPAKPAPAPTPTKKSPPSDNGIVIPGTPSRDPRIFCPPVSQDGNSNRSYLMEKF